MCSQAELHEGLFSDCAIRNTNRLDNRRTVNNIEDLGKRLTLGKIWEGSNLISINLMEKLNVII